MSGLAAAGAATPSTLLASSGRFAGLAGSIAQLEKDCGGRLGVFVLDVASDETCGHRADERFAMCSTFKMLLAAAVLKRADAGAESLDRRVAIPHSGLVHFSAITQEHAGSEMTIRDLCQAMVTRSDNTAANLLLDTIGGPNGVTQFARSIGDVVTRLDRIETALNEALPGDPRDTSTPAAMIANWRKLLLSDELAPSSRKQLTDWLIANKTGDERLRTGLNSAWTVGDKTGSNGETTTNDVAIVWPSAQAPPLLIAAYLTECPGPEEKRNRVLAGIGRLVTKTIQST